MSLDTKLEAALWYASQGLMVLPLHQIDTDGFCSCGAKGCAHRASTRGYPTAYMEPPRTLPRSGIGGGGGPRLTWAS